METDNKLLIRIDERQKAMDKTLVKIEETLSKIGEIYATKVELCDARKDSKDEISLVKNIVFTACAVILLGVLYTWLSKIGVNAQ